MCTYIYIYIERERDMLFIVSIIIINSIIRSSSITSMIVMCKLLSLIMSVADMSICQEST